MSYASPALPTARLMLDIPAIPFPSRALILRRAAFVAGSAAFAVALWTLLTAIILLG